MSSLGRLFRLLVNPITYVITIACDQADDRLRPIQLMKRQAYGFRDYEFFKLKIMALHETKHALVG
jgi:hypothetical protein